MLNPAPFHTHYVRPHTPQAVAAARRRSAGWFFLPKPRGDVEACGAHTTSTPSSATAFRLVDTIQAAAKGSIDRSSRWMPSGASKVSPAADSVDRFWPMPIDAKRRRRCLFPYVHQLCDRKAIESTNRQARPGPNPPITPLITSTSTLHRAYGSLNGGGVAPGRLRWWAMGTGGGAGALPGGRMGRISLCRHRTTKPARRR